MIALVNRVDIFETMSAVKPTLIIHGHFYQPPRENPWTGAIDPEPTAHPFPNWNERIFQECYRPNAFAEIQDEKGTVLKVVNNYAGISFNVGPTLFSWLEKFHPETYTRIIEADRESAGHRNGHGNAIAQTYVHAILPLCNERDRRTLARWGIAEFKHRFGRAPESLWLPETGCNDEMLGVLIDEGLKFVILAPTQAERVRTGKNGEWLNVDDGTMDTSQPYRYFHRDGSGRSIALFFYNDAVAKAIAFEGVLISSRTLVDRYENELTKAGQLVSAATDGESFGHHFRYGERGLAYALGMEAPKRGFRITNYGEYLEQHPPSMEVEIKKGSDGKGTAWSCPHGLGRWYTDCGCQVGGQEGWNQVWRGPLRQALDLLRDRAAGFFQESELFKDPWKTRDEYVGVILNPKTQPAFLGALLKNSGESEQAKARLHLELQKNALLMYSSCGWFFADISGLEAVLVLKFAGRVLDYFTELGLKSPEKEFLEILAEAKSNRPEMGSGADVFRRWVQSLMRSGNE